MKKLLEELDKKKDNYNQNCDYTKGIVKGLNIATSIVRNHTPWHEVSELPPKVEGKVYSIEVNVTDGETVRLGMYDYELGRWFIRGYRPAAVYFTPTHWAFLPEVNK